MSVVFFMFLCWLTRESLNMESETQHIIVANKYIGPILITIHLSVASKVGFNKSGCD